MKSIKEKAFFYLPSSRQLKVPGIITFEPDKGTNVELIGILSSPLSAHTIVQGHTANGVSMTLFQTFDTSFVFGTNGFNTANLYSRYLFKGLQFDSQKDLYFRRIQVNFNLLTDWLSERKSFDLEINTNNRTTTIKEKPIEKLEYQLPNDILLEIDYYSSTKFDGVHVKEASIKQHSCVVFKCHKRMRFDYLMDLIKHFQNFLTFVTLKSIYPTDVYIFFRTRGVKKYHKAEILFPISYLKEYNTSKLHPSDFVVPFTSIQHKFEYIIYRWFKIREKLNPIISEFCSGYYTPNMFPEDKFLSIARCLESFHRDFIDSRRISNFDRYLDLYKKGRYTFYTILKERSSNKFCEKLKTIRNDLTHNNPGRNKGNRNAIELINMTEKARIVFVSALLRELGLTNKEIKAQFKISRTLTNN